MACHWGSSRARCSVVNDVSITQLQPGDDAGFKAALAVYQEAILPSEQKAKEELRKLMGRRDYRFLVARREAAIVGMCVSHYSAIYFWLYEYAAVAPAERGRGIGALLFQGARASSNSIGLVEADADTSGDPQSEQARRLSFYERMGCRQLQGLDYVLPLRANGIPPPMVLLAHAPREVTGVPSKTVEFWLRSIYVDVYGQNFHDSRIATMIRGLPAEVALVSPTTGPATP